jgi:hypothetical protein
LDPTPGFANGLPTSCSRGVATLRLKGESANRTDYQPAPSPPVSEFLRYGWIDWARSCNASVEAAIAVGASVTVVCGQEPHSTSVEINGVRVSDDANENYNATCNTLRLKALEGRAGG